ncbi:aquaporin-like protein [Neohortaea acidophila]|uniref:Aquaporin-like protein n=1 Tax=Neohortaea acidophila TaxID=245834 RepID=A0A6A6Q3J8_9PEZI|nr:aquaporin-like protein [Neohortaea acidophila]KAF2486970.1 aquaporin-like protein [Neohortaea acidophila]
MNVDTPTSAEKRLVNRLFERLPPTTRGHVVAFIGEFAGTFFFLFFAFSGAQTSNVASNPNAGGKVTTKAIQATPSQLLYTALAFGFSLAVNVWVYFRISGGLFNPAVTLGMVLIRAISVFRGILLFIAQMVGAIVAAFVVQALFTGKLNVSTSLSPTTTIAQGVIIEMLLTSQLVFTIFMLAAEKHVGNFIAPLGIGLSLFIAELTGVFWTGGSLNPARSFAPQVALHSFTTEQWVYWVGPLAGSCLAVGLYALIKALEYHTANPDPEIAGPTGGGPGIVDAVNGVKREDNVKRAD